MVEKQSKKHEVSSSKGKNESNISIKPLRYMLPLMLRYRSRLIAAGVSLIAAAVTTLIFPMAVRRVIDHGFDSADSSLIDKYFAFLLLVAALLALTSASRYYFVIWIGERLVADLRYQVFNHLLNLSSNFYDNARSGELISRLNADTTQIKAALGASISIALRNILLFLGAIIMMLITSVQLSSMVLIAIPLIVLPLVSIGKLVRRRSRHAQDALADATAEASEAIQGVRTIQAFTSETIASNRYKQAIDKAFFAARSSTATRAVLIVCVIMLVFTSIVGILWMGAQQVLAGEMTTGRLGQFVIYSVFAAGAMSQLSQVWGELSLAAGAAERLIELLTIQADIQKPKNAIPLLIPTRGKIEFNQVDFNYPNIKETPILNDFSLTVEAGEKIAIVGPSGAGKSTLFQLIMRFYDPTTGSIHFDDQDITKLDPIELRKQIGIVAQDPLIFAASALDNIRIGNPNASMEQCIAAAKIAHIHDFIQSMPQGYNTFIGERGITLSGGQRQRMAIARAVIKDAAILLLDEATSALDAENERYIQESLEITMKGKTSFVIAHRLATVQKMDRIIVMDKGKIIETGNHDALISKGGLYQRLANLQFSA